MNKKVIDSLTGLFILAAVFVAIIAIVSRPALRRMLGRSVVVETWMPNAKVNTGDPVLFRSYRIGSVLDVVPHFDRTDNWFKVSVGVDSEWADHVPQRSTTTLSGGLVSGSSLEIVPPASDPGPSITAADGEQPIVFPFKAQPGLVDELTSSLMPHVEQILIDVETITHQVADENGHLQQTLANVRRVTGQVSDPQGDLQVSLGQFRILMERLNSEDGPVQSMLRKSDEMLANLEVITRDIADSKLQDEVKGMVTDGRGLMRELTELLASSKETLGNVETASSELPAMLASLKSIVGRLDTASRTLPGMAEEVRQAIHEANVTLRQVQDVMAELPFAGQPVTRPEAVEPIVLPTSIQAGAGGGR